MKRTELAKYWLLRMFSRVFPEGALKNGLRLCVLRLRPHLPKELMLNSGDCVLEVGTPFTKTVYRLVKSVGRSGRIIIVEPEKKNVEKLMGYVEANSLMNVIIIPKAAWSNRGRHKLLIAQKNDDHRLENDSIIHDNDFRDGGYPLEETVEVDTIDNMMRDVNVDAIDFVTVAVNGAEVHVLRGMEHVIEHTNRIFVKGHARLKGSDVPINHILVNFLSSKGFRIKVTKPSKAAVREWGKREGDVYAWRAN